MALGSFGKALVAWGIDVKCELMVWLVVLVGH